MALTKANKKRIEEEELYRSRIHETHANEKYAKPPKKGIGCGTIILLLIIAPFIIAGMIMGAAENGSKNSNNTSPAPTKQQELNASVNFTGTQFVITNLEKYDCQEARMKVNESYQLEGYTLAAGNTYTVGAAQFAKGDGTRLNPFAIKTQNFSIGCRGTNELSSAFWYGEF